MNMATAKSKLTETLRRHPDVEDARVSLRHCASGREQLIAWYLPAVSGKDESALRRYLLAYRELWYAPARLIAVDDLDSAPLPRERPRPLVGPPYRAPHTPVEQEIADTWAEVLGIEEVGLDDDFYELGGDSQAAIEAVVRLTPVLDPDARLTPPAEFIFLQHTTAARAAAAIEATS
jgi:hypothetical protein